MEERNGSLVYSFVARGSEILAEYSEGQFKSLSLQSSLQNLSSLSMHRISFTYHSHSFSFLVHGGFVYGVVATESMGRNVPMKFLETIKDEFTTTFAQGTSSMASHLSHNNHFRTKLKEHMRYHQEHSEDIQILSDKFVGIKEIIKQNIDLIVERKEELEILIDKTEELNIEAQSYKRIARSMNRNWKERLKNMMIKLIVIVLIILFLLIILLSISLKLTGLAFSVYLRNQIFGLI